jgi:hypothetical protein
MLVGRRVRPVILRNETPLFWIVIKNRHPMFYKMSIQLSRCLLGPGVVEIKGTHRFKATTVLGNSKSAGAWTNLRFSSGLELYLNLCPCLHINFMLPWSLMPSCWMGTHQISDHKLSPINYLPSHPCRVGQLNIWGVYCALLLRRLRWRPSVCTTVRGYSNNAVSSMMKETHTRHNCNLAGGIADEPLQFAAI